MGERKKATLKMKKALTHMVKKTKESYECSVYKYEEKNDRIYLVLERGELTDLSLDAIYECKIYGQVNEMSLTGRVEERYCGEQGKMLKMHIETGFYKKSIN